MNCKHSFRMKEILAMAGSMKSAPIRNYSGPNAGK